jgi:Ni/Fe-hydrogenase subunit HybB-like protein
MLALDVENMPPFLERMYRSGDPKKKELSLKIFNFMQKTFPFGIALAFILPSMHQASLGQLMYLAGSRVHPLWQTALLPLLYLLMAYILGFACVLLVLMLSSLAWDLGWDQDVLGRLAVIMSWMVVLWTAIRFADLAYRGALSLVFTFDRYSVVFLAETLLLLIPAILIQAKSMRTRPSLLFQLSLLVALGGCLYRFTPTTLAFFPLGDYRYFPSTAEILMSVGFTALGVSVFLYAVKKYAILPASASKVAAETALQPFDTL